MLAGCRPAPRLGEVAALGNPLIDVAVVDDAGHCIRRDNPDGYHAIVDPWLRSRFASAKNHHP